MGVLRLNRPERAHAYDRALLDTFEAAAVELAASHRVISAVPGQTYVGAIMGTPAYMPPEQARGVRVDERADVYAIGAILYHLLAGKAPYAGKTLDELLARVKEGRLARLTTVDPSIPADLAAIVERAMAREPADRYSSAADLAADLRRFTTGQLVSAHRYTRMQRIARFVGRNRAAVVIASAAIITGAVGGTIAVRNINVARDIADAESAKAVAAREEVRQRLIAAQVDRARVELAAGHDDLALAFTIAAAEGGGLDGRLRFIAARALAGLPRTRRLAGGGLVTSGDFAADSHDLIIGRKSQVVRWDPETNQIEWTYDVQSTGLLMSEGSRQAVVAGPNGIQWLDGNTGAIVGRAEPPAGKRLVGNLATDHTHRSMAMNVEGGGLLVHDSTTSRSDLYPLPAGMEVQVLSPDATRFVVSIALPNGGTRMAIVDRKGSEIASVCASCMRIETIGDDLVVSETAPPYAVRIITWSGKVLTEVRPVTNMQAVDIAPDRDSRRFALVTSDGSIEMHDRSAGLLWYQRVQDQMYGVNIDQLGRVWSIGLFNGVDVFDGATGVHLVKWPQTGGLLCFVSQDGAYAASVSLRDGTIAWRVPPMPVRAVAPTRDRVRRLAFLDGDRFVSASDNGLVALHERDTWREIGKHDQRIVNLEIVGGDKVLTSSRDNTAVLRDLTGKEIVRIPAGALRATAASDGTIAIGSVTGAVAIWERGAARPLGDFGREVSALRWSPDGALLAAMDDEGAIVVWRRDGAKMRAIPKRGKSGLDLTFSPRGTWLAASDSHEGPETLYSMTGGADRILEGATTDEHLSLAFAFSSDEQRVAIAGMGILRTWDIPTGRSLDLRPVADSTGALLSRDGTLLYVGSLDSKVLVRAAATGDPITSITASTAVYGLASSADEKRLGVLTLGPALVWDTSSFAGDLAELKRLADCRIDVRLAAGSIVRDGGDRCSER